MTEDLCVCGPMTRADGYCECGADPDLKPLTHDEEGQAELRWGGLNPGDSLDRPYFDLDGNAGTYSEVYS